MAAVQKLVTRDFWHTDDLTQIIWPTYIGMRHKLVNIKSGQTLGSLISPTAIYG